MDCFSRAKIMDFRHLQVPEFRGLLPKFSESAVCSAFFLPSTPRCKEYFHAFDYYQGKVLFVGINYDEKKKHTCEITEWVK